MRRILLGLCICALSACSSSGSSKATSTTTASTAAGDSTSSSPADTADTAGTPTSTSADAGTTPVVAPGNVDPCSIVTTADVAAVFGGTVAEGVINPDNGGCDYEITGMTNTGDSGVLTQVSISLDGEYETYDNEKVVFPDIEKIDGLGSGAWYYSFGSQLHIDLGNQELLISGIFPGDDAAVKAEVIAFATTVIGKL